MLSDVDVLNLALRFIGHQPVTAFTDASPQAVNGRLAWELVKREFLASADWTFATKFQKLVPFYSPVIWEYTNAHLLPVDFARLSAISGFTSSDKFSIILNDGVKLLASNKAEVSIRYITLDYSIPVMSGLALNAFVAALALRLDMMLNGSVNASSLIQFAADSLGAAIRHEGTARGKCLLTPSPLLEARNG